MAERTICQNIIAKSKSSTVALASKTLISRWLPILFSCVWSADGLITLATTIRQSFPAWKLTLPTLIPIPCFKSFASCRASGKSPKLMFSYLVPRRIACFVKPASYSECSAMPRASIVSPQTFLEHFLPVSKVSSVSYASFDSSLISPGAAAALGLMDWDDESSTQSYTTLIQTFNRFIIESMATAAELTPFDDQRIFKWAATAGDKPLSPIMQMFGIETTTVSVCFHCAAKTTRAGITSVLDLIYPRKVCRTPDRLLGLSNSRATQAMSNEHPPSADFQSILRASLSRETTTKTTCSSCRQPTHLRVRRILSRTDGAFLPPVLAINAGVHTPEHVGIWLDRRGERFLLPRIGISPDGDNIEVSSESNDAQTTGSAGTKTIYGLRVRRFSLLLSSQLI